MIKEVKSYLAFYFTWIAIPTTVVSIMAPNNPTAVFGYITGFCVLMIEVLLVRFWRWIHLPKAERWQARGNP